MNFIKNIANKYIYKCYVMKRQKVIFHNNLIAFITRSDEFFYNNLVEFLFSIDFNNARYFITFKNNFIYYFKVYYIRYKSKIFVIFLRFKIYLKSLDFKIYCIRLDNNNKYIIKLFLVYLL